MCLFGTKKKCIRKVRYIIQCRCPAQILTAFLCRVVAAPDTTALSPQGRRTGVYGNARRFIEIAPCLRSRSRYSEIAKIETVFLGNESIGKLCVLCTRTQTAKIWDYSRVQGTLGAYSVGVGT